jgi:5-formyltetrahydrofolate cyclo-ligase
MEKDELRKKYLVIRDNVIDKENKSRIIFNKIINHEYYKNAKVIAIYNSFKSEVDTKYLINYSLNNNKIVLLPRIEKDNMNFYRIDSLNNLVKNKYGIDEPINNNLYNKEDIDLMIVPGIVFDKNNNRIGYGKGYYDKYLKNSSIYTIGILYSEQLIDNIEVTNNDIKLNEIITN